MTRVPSILVLSIGICAAGAEQGRCAEHANAIPQPRVTAEMRDFTTGGYASLINGPNGSGRSFANAFGPGGVRANAVITRPITIADNGEPVAYLPAEDIWLESIPDPMRVGLVPCGGYATADSNTDMRGESVFAEPLLAGGKVR